MEGGAFLDERIQKEFGRFVEIVLHTDGQGKREAASTRNRDYQLERFNTVALPLYVLLDPSGERVLWKRAGKVSTEDFLAALKAVSATP